MRDLLNNGSIYPALTLTTLRAIILGNPLVSHMTNTQVFRKLN